MKKIDAGMVMLIHSGVDRAFCEPFHCTPTRLGKVLDTFPGAPIIKVTLEKF